MGFHLLQEAQLACLQQAGILYEIALKSCAPMVVCCGTTTIKSLFRINQWATNMYG